MDRFDVQDGMVYPVQIRYAGGNAVVGFCWTPAGDDALLKDGTGIRCFDSIEELCAFCEDNALILSEETVCYDYTIVPANPVLYRQVLDRWNLLSTVSQTTGMYFSGNEKKYNRLYDRLFYLCTSAVPISDRSWLNESELKQMKTVFRRQNRLLERALRER